MLEVEVKVPLKDPQALYLKLKAAGAVLEKHVYEKDTYFDDASGSIRISDSALRLREIKDCISGNTHYQLNYKGKKLNHQTMTRKEIETGIDSLNAVRDILDCLHFRPIGPDVIKERMEYRLDGVTLCYDRVDGLGFFMEAEILSEEGQYKQALQDIESVLRIFGLTLADSVTESYLSMLMDINKR